MSTALMAALKLIGRSVESGHLIKDSFALAVTKFYGRFAPPHPVGIPEMPIGLVRQAGGPNAVQLPFIQKSYEAAFSLAH